MEFTGLDQYQLNLVPDTLNHLTAQQMDELRESINPLESCDDVGVSLYARTCVFVDSLIS